MMSLRSSRVPLGKFVILMQLGTMRIRPVASTANALMRSSSKNMLYDVAELMAGGLVFSNINGEDSGVVPAMVTVALLLDLVPAGA